MAQPWNLDFYKSGEYQVVLERLDDLTKKQVRYCPDRKNLFKALAATKLEDVKVCLLGQDPYPNKRYATGLAFSIPADSDAYPPTLQCILDEYVDDLHYPYPETGDLSPWTERGVLLWNTIPSCEAGKSLSHRWEEWEWCTKEILLKLQERGDVVFAALGSVAREALLKHVSDAPMVITGHPSPRGNKFSNNPFKGSRFFTTVNVELVRLGLTPVDWRLP